MAKAPPDIRSLARQHSETAINTLRGIASSKSAPAAARVTAACALLDRGYGKPASILAGDEDGGPIQLNYSTKELARRILSLTEGAIDAEFEDVTNGKLLESREDLDS